MGFEEFLKEVTPLLGLAWRPFKRRGIRRRVERRLRELGFFSLWDYESRIKDDPEEQKHLSRILTVTISRFFRDRDVFSQIETSVLPAILHQKNTRGLHVWSIGCASGEEPYSFSLLWKARHEKHWPQVAVRMVGTDSDESLLERAKAGRYKKSSVEEIPGEILKEFFNTDGEHYLLDRSVRQSVEFRRHDILRDETLSGMDIVFCRNLAFTYFSRESQMVVMRKIAVALKEKGYFIVGKEESLPPTYPTLFVPVSLRERIYRKFDPFGRA